MAAYVAGLEERLRRGLPVDHIASVASFFVSRVDTAVDRLLAERGRDNLAGRAAIANARLAYARAAELFDGERFAHLRRAGARPQRLLWASTGTKDPKASDVLYVKALAAPFTVNTMPEGTLRALADHGGIGEPMSADGGDGEAVLGRFADAGIDVDSLGDRLQDEGTKSFVSSWNELMGVIAAKSATLAKAL
jgi:transaldolase